MAPHHRALVLLWSLALWLALATGQPQSTINYFDNLPARLFFFDDATDAIYHDVVKGNVIVSPDEGKTWKQADGVPEGEAAMVIEHPFDNRLAFILSRGKTHWRTTDRGKSWQTFTMPLPPALIGRPLSFHSDPSKYNYILYQGTACDNSGGWGSLCHDETYFTTDAFADTRLLMLDTSRCQFAHSSKDFKHEAHPDLIYCVAFDSSSTSGSHSLAASRVYSSTDFFQTEKKLEDFGIGKNARGVVAFAIVSKFAVVAMKDLDGGSRNEMILYVSVDTKTWAKASFPHSTSARLRENAYTIVESTTHSLAVDVLNHDRSAIGTLFVSNSNGTFFVESLKDTNRNEMGYVDFETIYGVEGVGLANVVRNAQEVDSHHSMKQLQTRITFDDGRSWSRLRPPSEDSDGRRISCSPGDDDCSLHLHSVTLPHNFGRVFSSPAPGIVMGVGSIGNYLKPYEESETFLSTDGGVTWKMVHQGAHKYEFGDQGSILVTVNDEEGANEINYSTDFGRSWQRYDFGLRLRARLLTTVGDSTSQKFLLIGQVARSDQKSGQGRFAAVFLDFATLSRPKCSDSDFEPWFARSSTHECLMGHRQSYRRRRPDANCYVGEKFRDPVPSEDPCPCRDEDYECDYNFIKVNNECVAAGPEPIPDNVCLEPHETYMGSSGYRLIPGNTCDRERGVKKDDKVQKSCGNAQPQEGQIIHRIQPFPAPLVQYSYFAKSTTILARLADHSVWQSPNEGYTWNQIQPGETFVAFYHHTFANDRAYLITNDKYYWYTTDTGRSWNKMTTQTLANSFGLPVLHFHPKNSDWIIWTGSEGCTGFGENCHVQTHYSLDNGRKWEEVGKYMRNCAWARDEELLVDPRQIICESFKDKKGNQRAFTMDNPLELIGGTDFFNKQTKLFDHVVGFAKFSEFLIVAEYQTQKRTLDIQVSLDGRIFAPGEFPPNMRPEQHAYTILESSTKSVFLHVTTSEPPAPFWGNILKSNSNGTYFGLSIDNVNRNDAGYVDFEKMIDLDGIALINVVGNPHEAPLTGRKLLQSRITHNDGGSWRPLTPPSMDSLGNRYACDNTKCALHVHGYTERYDVRATYSTPSVPGLMMAVGNVGEYLEGYDQSDTFLSRDAGFTWEEVHKDAHLWEFGDSGSILIMANDEGPTDHVMFSTDEGKKWREYKFTDEAIRVKSIVTVPEDTSRRFILMGYSPRAKNGAVAVHLDFSSLTRKMCKLDPEDPVNDDFELWSPSEEREEQCLFGHQTLYHRRRRHAQCIVGDQEKAKVKIVKNCECKQIDFECEFNHVRENGECVLLPGLGPRDPDMAAQCRDGASEWYDLTAYRKIPVSTCEGGTRLDRGTAHPCPGISGHGSFFWLMMFFIPIAFAGLIGYWWHRRGSSRRGAIRLPGGEAGPRYSDDSGVLSTLASIPWFLIGLGGIAYEWVAEKVESAYVQMRGRSGYGYRNLSADEDAQILRFEDEE